jgi:hypothetical protein
MQNGMQKKDDFSHQLSYTKSLSRDVRDTNSEEEINMRR